MTQFLQFFIQINYRSNSLQEFKGKVEKSFDPPAWPLTGDSIIITVMNYYSRNSPVKHKKSELPAGFLLQPDSPHSQQPTHRSRITRYAHSQKNSRSSFEEQSSISSQQILILDDDSYHVPADQILIEDNQSEDEEILNRIEIIQEESESSECQSNAEIAESQTHSQDSQREQILQQISPKEQQDSQKIVQSTVHNKAQLQQKLIHRNYSFGNQHELWDSSSSEKSSVVSADPLIRRLIDPDAILKIQNSKKYKKKFKKSNKSLKQKEEELQQPNQQENWKKMIRSFIKKRQNWKQTASREEGKQQGESETGEVNSEVVVGKKQEDLGSGQSGYFPGLKSENSGSLRESNRSQEKMDENLDSQIKKQVPLFNQNQSLFEKPSKFSKYEMTILREKQQIFGYDQSLSMLMETIQQLPKAMVPHYLAIHNQLVKRQHQNRETIRRQNQMIEMMKIMKKMQENSVYVDDYVLQQFKQEEEEKVAANQEIILSLIRRLALHF